AMTRRQRARRCLLSPDARRRCAPDPRRLTPAIIDGVGDAIEERAFLHPAPWIAYRDAARGVRRLRAVRPGDRHAREQRHREDSRWTGRESERRGSERAARLHVPPPLL